MMKTLFATLAVVSFSWVHVASADQIAGFDAQDLSIGDLSLPDLQKSFQNPDNLSRSGFKFDSKFPVRFEAVAVGNAGQSLRLHLPQDGEGSKSVYISFGDPKLKDYVKLDAPLVFECKIQTPSDRNSLLCQVISLSEGKTHAAALFRSPSQNKSQTEPTFDLPANEPVEIKITLSSQGDGIFAVFQAKSASGFSEEKEWMLPGTENFTLADIQLLNLIAAPEEGAPATYLDIFSIRISQ
jgi:hypothetical protein